MQNTDAQTLLNYAQDDLERVAIVSLEMKETLSFFAKEAIAPLSKVGISDLPQALESFYKASNALVATMAPILSRSKLPLQPAWPNPREQLGRCR